MWLQLVLFCEDVLPVFVLYFKAILLKDLQLKSGNSKNCDIQIKDSESVFVTFHPISNIYHTLNFACIQQCNVCLQSQSPAGSISLNCLVTFRYTLSN